jgi:hypothetical protein
MFLAAIVAHDANLKRLDREAESQSRNSFGLFGNCLINPNPRLILLSFFAVA